MIELVNNLNLPKRKELSILQPQTEYHIGFIGADGRRHYIATGKGFSGTLHYKYVAFNRFNTPMNEYQAEMNYSQLMSFLRDQNNGIFLFDNYLELAKWGFHLGD